MDFYFNEIYNLKPISDDKYNISKEVGYTVINPTLGDAIVLICPKPKNNDFLKAELVPPNCFSSHLYSPYTAAKNEKDLEKLGIDKKYNVQEDFDDYYVNILFIPNFYKHDKVIYCRCDNRLTEIDGEGKKKISGKTGIAKIILDNKTSKPKGLDFTGSNELNDGTVNIEKKTGEIVITENETIHIKIHNMEIEDFIDCNIINIKYNIIYNDLFSFRMPSFFQEDIKCKFIISDKDKQIYTINLSAEKSKTIEGCDFTAKKGDGVFKNGFILKDISNEEKICTVYIGSHKKRAVGIKCPYNITPKFCFRLVLFEKEIDGEKKYDTFLLNDILGTRDLEFFSNLKEGNHVLALPTKPEKYSVVRCECEDNGKKGIMEIKIASGYSSFISSILLFISIILLLLF